MFKKILVPLDGSELATKVFPQVIDLAKTQDAQVTLLNVYSDWGEPDSEEVARFMEAEVQKCQSFLGAAADDLRGQGLRVDTACVKGAAAHEIIAYADQNGMDLIAMASHGTGEVAWILGSVAEKVVSHATVPVLLFRVLGARPQRKTDFLDLIDRGLP